MFFASLLEVDLPPDIPLLLAMAVWAIYTIDHLWDARRSQNPLISFRHEFHKKHFTTLMILLITIVVIGLTRITFLPPETLRWGIGLTSAVIMYFLISGLTKSPIYHKEMLIATIYTAGVLVGPISLVQRAFSFPEYLIFGLFFVLAFTNLILFSLYEFEADKVQNFSSLSQTIGRKRSKSLILVLLILVSIISLFTCWYWFGDALISTTGLVIFAMSVVLFVIYRVPQYFTLNHRYRYFGDAIFFFPALAL